MDKINLKGMKFYGYHGVLKTEKEIGQKFEVDLTLYLDLDDASKNDDLDKTVNYAKVFDLIKSIFDDYKFNLIERVAGKIIEEIFDHFDSVEEIEIEVKKPEAPVKGIFQYFSVELRRKRNE